MSDFSVYTAGQIRDWMSQGTIDAAPSNIYVALFDSAGNEVSGDFVNDRVETTAGTDWEQESGDTTSFTNANNLDFGEAEVDVNDIVDVALYDDTLSNGGNEIARYAIDDSPFDVSAGTNHIFLVNDLSFDVRDRTE